MFRIFPIIAIIAVISAYPVSAAVDVAEGKPCFASDTWRDNKPGNATTGKGCWCTVLFGGFIYVDLGANCSFDRVEVDKGIGYERAYTVEALPDGANPGTYPGEWRTVVPRTVDMGSAIADQFVPVTARYLRYTVHKDEGFTSVARMKVLTTNVLRGRPVISATPGIDNPGVLTDGKLDTAVVVPPSGGEISVALEKPVAINGVRLVGFAGKSSEPSEYVLPGSREATALLAIKLPREIAGWRLAEVEAYSFPVAMTPRVITPNGDGVRDSVTQQLPLAVGLWAHARVLGSDGRLVQTITSDGATGEMVWNGKGTSGQPSPSGTYTLETRLSAQAGYYSFPADVQVETTPPWPAQPRKPLNVFPIGLWYQTYHAGGTPFEAYLKQSLTDLAAHGLDTVSAFPPSSEQARAVLDAAQAAGMRVILQLGEFGKLVERAPEMSEREIADEFGRLTAACRNHPALLAYQIVDEPGKPATDNVRTLVKIAEAVDPVHPTLFNNFPSLMAIEHLDREVCPRVRCFDRYPVTRAVTSEGFVVAAKDYVRFATASYRMRPDVPQWAYVQCASFQEYLRRPTPEEQRAVTYIAIASGVTGIHYFLYHDEGTGEFPWLGGFVTEDTKKPYPNYGAIPEIARRVKSWAPTLLRCRLVADADCDATVADGDDATLAHMFRDGAGTRYLLVVNLDTTPGRTRSVRVRVPAGCHSARAVGTSPGVLLRGTMLKASLQPGDATLVALQ